MKPLLEMAGPELVEKLNAVGVRKTFAGGEEIFAPGDTPRFALTGEPRRHGIAPTRQKGAGRRRY